MAVNQEKRTLLHMACLHFADGQHEVGKRLVRLLLDKGVNPGTLDVLSKKAMDYVAPHSAIHQLLLKPPGELCSVFGRGGGER